MSLKNQSQSNAETEDCDEEDRSLRELLAESPPIVEVWDYNFQEQLKVITELSNKYNVIAVDTEFPGTFIKKYTIREKYNDDQIDYQHVKQNVETTKLIQFGLSLSDADGNSPLKDATWQFNFSFQLAKENTVYQSINLLEKAGVNFAKLGIEGINHKKFADSFMTSGLVLNKNIKWVAFHGAYDFSYLLRLLRNQPLPQNSYEYMKSVKLYFPQICDLKTVIESQQNFCGIGLDFLASKLGCDRCGAKHQAGSDSLLTLRCYFRLQKIVKAQKFSNSFASIFGIGLTASKPFKGGTFIPFFESYKETYCYQNGGFYENSFNIVNQKGSLYGPQQNQNGYFKYQ